MQLPKTVEYALRAMAYMANLPLDTAVRAQDLAVATNVPPHFLSKLMRRLVVAGLLRSQRGHHGGFVLAMPPRFIRALYVLIAAHHRLNPTHCAFGWGNCRPAEPCPLHPVWSKLNDAIGDWARSTTLADMQVHGGLPPPGDVARAIPDPGDGTTLRRARSHIAAERKRGRFGKTARAVPELTK